MGDIVRHRGDTRPIEKTLKLNGVPFNITGWTFKLTVNAVALPLDETDQITQIVGTITNAAGGQFEFAPDPTDVETAVKAYFDIQGIDAAGKISTLDDGQWVLLQDKTK